jgi:hypothetical protein
MHPFLSDDHVPGTAAVTDEERREHARETFLGASRALPACTREFERLNDEITKRLAATDAETIGAKPEVRRAPGRCIVQLGPVAITVSWVRARVDTAAAGRLLIVEWEGTVARGAERIPERAAVRPTGRAPQVLREQTLLADATSEQDWRWRREDAPAEALTSAELAERCVASLLESLKARAS